MITLILLLLISYSFDIILVGICFAAIKKAFRFNISIIFSLIILMFLFALLENMLLPFVSLLDITFTIHNKEISDFLELKENISASVLYSIDYFDFIIWFIQSVVALYVIDKSITKKLSAI